MSTSYRNYFDLHCPQCGAAGHAIESGIDYDYPSAYAGPDPWSLSISDNFERAPDPAPQSLTGRLLVCTVCGAEAKCVRAGAPISRAAMRVVADSDRCSQSEYSPADFAERQKLRKRAFIAGFERGASSRVRNR